MDQKSSIISWWVDLSFIFNCVFNLSLQDVSSNSKKFMKLANLTKQKFSTPFDINIKWIAGPFYLIYCFFYSDFYIQSKKSKK